MMRLRATFQILCLCLWTLVLTTLRPDLLLPLAFVPEASLHGLTGIFTHMFAHAGFLHLAGNFSFGLPFMAYIELKYGPAKLWEVFMCCGLFGLLTQLMLAGPGAMVGSSAAMAGIMAVACMRFGASKPERLLSRSLLLFFMLVQLYLAQNTFSDVAHYAHLGGCLGGMTLAPLLGKWKAKV